MPARPARGRSFFNEIEGRHLAPIDCQPEMRRLGTNKGKNNMSKARLVRLKSYEALPEDLRRAILLHVLHGIDGAEACWYVGRNNGRRDWERQQIQAVLADYRTDDTDNDWVAALEMVNPEFNALNTPQNAPSGSPRSDSQEQEHTSASPETPQDRPEHECADCGRSAGSTYGSRWLCPSCMNRALGFKPTIAADVPAAPAPVLPKFGEPIRTLKACLICKDRLAWYDGVTCGPCAGAEEKPKSGQIVLGGTETGVDAGDLFPNIHRELEKGRSGLDVWREQARAESEERAALIRRLQGQQEPTF